MLSPSSPRYFLGSNSRYGFHSLYHEFCPAEEGCFLNVIKGGPGCGKSSFMKRIGAAAEERGFAVEYVLCSGDPDSIDGVYLPALGLGYVDGTAPHSMDAIYPGSSAMYLDLGRFYDMAALKPHNKDIMDINRRYKSLYSAAYSYISAGTSALPRYYPGIWRQCEREKVQKKAEGFARREFKGSKEGKGRVQRRFLGSLGCKGRIFLSDSLVYGCQRLCVLDNELGMGHFYLEELLRLALAKSYDAIVCPDCLDPKLISSLLIPELSLALFCSDALGEPEVELYRHIRLDAIANRETISALRPTLRRAKHLSRDYLSLATDTLAKAKALHDELEAVYNPHVDFDGVYREAEAHIKALL